MNKKKNLTSLTFEEAVKSLEKIVSDMENGDLSLDKTIESYTQGIELLKLCKGQLSKAQKRVDVLKDDSLEPFEDETDAK